MKSNHSELERQERKLRHIHWYQILMSLFLIVALCFIVFWAVTFSKLKAQEKLRSGDFKQISLIIRLTQKSENIDEGEEIIVEDGVFKFYNGPTLAKDYYGKSLGFYLNTTSADYFETQNGSFLTGVKIPGVPKSQDKGWKILSYSEPDVDEDHFTNKGLKDLLLDRVNVFVFQLQI